MKVAEASGDVVRRRLPGGYMLGRSKVAMSVGEQNDSKGSISLFFKVFARFQHVIYSSFALPDFCFQTICTAGVPW